MPTLDEYRNVKQSLRVLSTAYTVIPAPLIPFTVQHVGLAVQQPDKRFIKTQDRRASDNLRV